jgi:hypothetical protein
VITAGARGNPADKRTRRGPRGTTHLACRCGGDRDRAGGSGLRIKDRFIKAPLETATFDGRVWGVPSYTNAALLYYRKDKVSSVPATWQDLCRTSRTGRRR